MQEPVKNLEELIDPLIGVWRGTSQRRTSPPSQILPILFQMNLDYTYLVTVLGAERSLTFGRWERREENLWVGRSIYMIIPSRVEDDKFLAEGVIKLKIGADPSGEELLIGCFERTTEPFEALAEPVIEENLIEGTILAKRVDLSLDDVPSDFCEFPIIGGETVDL